MIEKEIRKLKCPNCSVLFQTKHSQRKYCCITCKLEYANVRFKENYVNTDKEKTLSNTKDKRPLPGDVVYAVTIDESKIRNESLGIITGYIGEYKDECNIYFNPYLPVMISKDMEIKCASGFSVVVKTKDVHTRGTIQMLFKKLGVSTADQLILVKRLYVNL